MLNLQRSDQVADKPYVEHYPCYAGAAPFQKNLRKKARRKLLVSDSGRSGWGYHKGNRAEKGKSDAAPLAAKNEEHSTANAKGSP